MTTIKFRDFANVKRTAGIVQPLVAKKNRIEAQIIALGHEYNLLKDQIESHQNWVKAISGGYTTEDLVVRKKDAEGKDMQGYDANPNRVRFDEDKRVFVVIEDTEDTNENLQAVEPEAAGSDFDNDSMVIDPTMA